jgi:hypothetical protein
MGEVVGLPGGTVILQDAAEAFLDQCDLARSSRRVYRASLAGLVTGLGPATAVGELSGPRLAGWFRRRYATAAPTTWNRELATLRAAVGWWHRRGWLAPRPNQRPSASPGAGRPHPGSHPRAAGGAVCPPRSCPAGTHPVAAAVRDRRPRQRTPGPGRGRPGPGQPTGPGPQQRRRNRVGVLADRIGPAAPPPVGRPDHGPAHGATWCPRRGLIAGIVRAGGGLHEHAGMRTPTWVRAALSHPCCTGIARQHLDEPITELADPGPPSARPC